MPSLTTEAPAASVDELSQAYDRLRSEISRVIVGQESVIRMVNVSLLAGGHVLLIGVPGLAKTLLVRTLADCLDLDFSRIQFTPDLMPSDITGTEILQQDEAGRQQFTFARGPLFANIILADEINRTPPKTQAALLEAMQEHHITAAGTTHVLEEPFFVLATQNPIEQEGTYPLPEAQLDRFMLNLWLDYPSFDEEMEVVRKTTSDDFPEIEAVLSAEELLSYQKLVRQLPVADHVIEHAVKLVGQTRPQSSSAPDYVQQYLSYGAGPRASQFLILAAKAMAAMEGRSTPVPEDLRDVAIPILRHRIVTNFSAESDSVKDTDILERLLDERLPA